MTDRFNLITPEVIFQNTTTSYKFFWGIALLNLHKNTGKTVYECNDVVLRMICEAYSVLDNNKIFLGNVDHFRTSMYFIKKFSPPVCCSPDELYAFLIKDKYKYNITRLVSYYRESVPFRFLAPWAPKDPSHPYSFDRKPLGQESIMFTASAPYVIFKEGNQWVIKVNPQWVHLFGRNQNELIKVVIERLAVYIAHRNELSKEHYVTLLESILLNENESLVSPATQQPKDEKNSEKVQLPVYKSKDVKHTPQIEDLGGVSTRAQHSGNSIRGGKIIALGDKELLSALVPLVKSSKLRAVEFLINYFAGFSGLNMTFTDWALLIDTIPVEETISPSSLRSGDAFSPGTLIGRSQPKDNLEAKKKTRIHENGKNSSDWKDVDFAINGIARIHDLLGGLEAFPSFVVDSIHLVGNTLSLYVKARSSKTNKRYVICLLFSDVTYFHTSLYLNNEQHFRISYKKDYSRFKYRIGDSNIYINSDKAQVKSIREL